MNLAMYALATLYANIFRLDIVNHCSETNFRVAIIENDQYN